MTDQQVKIKVKTSEFTMPKENLPLFAISTAIDLDQFIVIKTEKQAIEFLEGLGMKISEVK